MTSSALSDEDLRRTLLRRQLTLGGAFSSLILAGYLSYVLWVVFAPAAAGRAVVGFITWQMAGGFGLLAGTMVLTAIYAWTNARYLRPLARELARRAHG